MIQNNIFEISFGSCHVFVTHDVNLLNLSDYIIKIIILYIIPKITNICKKVMVKTENMSP